MGDSIYKFFVSHRIKSFTQMPVGVIQKRKVSDKNNLPSIYSLTF